ncbi:zinc-finger domain-containing protein [Hyphococcus sp. DH-69]|uniref:zinc-finger domain-containing protein n=1 Tax=Hyphococcus formosus TaxID=3143534 RepID=UPI00398B0F1E
MSGGMTAPPTESVSILRWESEGGSVTSQMPPLYGRDQIDGSESAAPRRLSKLRNDEGIAEIRIGMREFECIGASPPHDHPHVYLNMGLSDSMLCPYCATAFYFDTALAPDGVMPRECLYRKC